MTRKYTRVKHLEAIVFEMKGQGISNAEIGEALGLTKTQIKDLVNRHNRRERNTGKGIPPRRRGRPRTKSISTMKSLEAENARLKMENELLRDFLSTMEGE